jgi:membrane fusion protein (multidrug efflux system)
VTRACLKDNAITRKQADDTKSLYETAQKQLLSSQDQLAFAESQINNSRAQIEKVQALIKAKQAALKNAELRLTYTKMLAPYSGKVGKSNLQKGQYVQPGQTLFNVIDNEQFWITANFKETQLEKLKVGMPADVIMDGYPQLKIHAKVSDFPVMPQVLDSHFYLPIMQLEIL